MENIKFFKGLSTSIAPKLSNQEFPEGSLVFTTDKPTFYLIKADLSYETFDCSASFDINDVRVVEKIEKGADGHSIKITYTGEDSPKMETIGLAYPLVSTSADGLMSKEDKVKLNSLDDTIESAINASLTKVYKYKGSVNNVADLPTDVEEGDVYNVVNADGNTPAGTNYAYNGTEWDALGGTIDLSNYATNDYLQELADSLKINVSTTPSVGISLQTNDNNDLSINVNAADHVSGLKTEIVSKITANDLKIGGTASENSSILPTDTIKKTLEDLEASISSAVSGGITSVTSGDGIKVTGTANAKTVGLNLAEGSALKINENNALSLVWEEV